MVVIAVTVLRLEQVIVRLGDDLLIALVLPLLHLDDLQNDGVFGKHAEYMKDAHDHPSFDGSQALRFGSVIRHMSEDVDKHQE